MGEKTQLKLRLGGFFPGWVAQQNNLAGGAESFGGFASDLSLIRQKLAGSESRCHELPFEKKKLSALEIENFLLKS